MHQQQAQDRSQAYHDTGNGHFSDRQSIDKKNIGHQDGMADTIDLAAAARDFALFPLPPVLINLLLSILPIVINITPERV